jgi:uncharacterized protein (TIGR00299 family) protein
MKTLLIEPIFGISGDMFNGALLDASNLFNELKSELNKLKIPQVDVEISTVTRSNIRATRFNVIDNSGNKSAERHYSDIIDMIDASDLSKAVREKAKTAFNFLGRVEAEIHNIDISELHFHEVGSVDSIFDIVSAFILLDFIAVEKVFSTSVANGTDKSIENFHGKTFCASPAALKLQESMRSTFLPIPAEITTPTGVAILKTINPEFVELPKSMRLEKIGYGAGSREFDHPNVLRIGYGVIEDVPFNYPVDKNGSARIEPPGFVQEEVDLLSTNLDDVTPEILAFASEKLLNLGAYDCWVIPIAMKKGRHGFELNVICNPNISATLIEAVSNETKSLGVRVNRQFRYVLNRYNSSVIVDGCKISIKVSPFGFKAEYDDLAAAARALNRSISDLKKEAEFLYSASENVKSKES